MQGSDYGFASLLASYPFMVSDASREGQRQQEISPCLSQPLALTSTFACCSQVTSRDSPKWIGLITNCS